MEVITQTNRTMLFEEINPEKLNLLTLVGDAKDVESLDDAKIKEIHEALLVRSFDEFLNKFEPVVYSYFNAANQSVAYTLEKPEGIPEEYISEIPLNQQNDFLNMLFTLMDTKRAQGIINVDFKFEKILDMISPKKIMRDIKQVRKEIHYLYGEYEKLDDEDPKKLDLGDKLNYKFEEASQNYNNVMAMLPLAIEDIKTRLLLTQSPSQKNEKQLALGMLQMGENGELKVLEIPQKEKQELLALSTMDTNTELAETFKEDYDSINEEPSEYIRSLVVRTFCPMTAVVNSDVNVEQEVENYNTYLAFYKNAKDDFIKTVKPLVEKLLGVKVFFEQYNTKEKGMVPSLLVTNTKLDMLVSSMNIDRLKTYLNTVNTKNDYTNTVWLGIVPDIELAAYQCPEYLKEFYSNVTSKYPGVRYDIEAGDHSLKTVTTMGKEITGFTNTIKNVINNKGFGFVFASESSQIQGKEVRNITVYKARTMAMMDDAYDSLYKTMVSTYVERMLRYLSNDFKQENVTNFFSNNPKSQKSLWEADKKYINGITQQGDELDFVIDETTNDCNIKLGFNGNVKNLKVSITKGTTGSQQ